MISNDMKVKLMTSMLRIRRVEEEIAKKYSEQEMRCPVHLSIGQEAPSAAFAHAVQKDDYAISTHRGHAHFLAKGGSLKSMIAEIYGKETGCSKGRGGSMHLADKEINFMGTSAIVGNSIPIGVGLGLSLKIRKIPQISFIFLGDGAVEEGVFYESLNFSAVKNLPVLFMCENNKYSVYSDLSVRQPKDRKIFEMVRSIGVDSIEVDGNNIEECFEVISLAAENIRNGSGPFFIEFQTYRHLEHCGPNNDDKLGYRSGNEIQSWLKKDPVLSYLDSLIEGSVLTNSDIHGFEKEIANEIEIAFQYARNSKFPNYSDLAQDVYAI